MKCEIVKGNFMSQMNNLKLKFQSNFDSKLQLTVFSGLNIFLKINGSTVYIIECKDNSLYTGITTDINRRFYEHQNDDNKSSKYRLMRRPLALVFKSRPFKIEVKHLKKNIGSET